MTMRKQRRRIEGIPQLELVGSHERHESQALQSVGGYKIREEKTYCSMGIEKEIDYVKVSARRYECASV